MTESPLSLVIHNSPLVLLGDQRTRVGNGSREKSPTITSNLYISEKIVSLSPGDWVGTKAPVCFLKLLAVSDRKKGQWWEDVDGESWREG